jgi:hypothetical protein
MDMEATADADPTPSPDVTSPPALTLARRFAEQLVAEAVESGPHVGTSGIDPAVDWPAIWASADGTTSPERAAGRLVLAANRVAHTVSGTPPMAEGLSLDHR